MTASVKTFPQACRAFVPVALPEPGMDASPGPWKRIARMNQICELLGVAHPADDIDEYGCHYHVVGSGGTIYALGERLEKIYFVVSGTVKTLFQDAETTVIADFMLSGAILGLDGLDRFIYSNSAVAVSDVLLLCLPYSSFVTYSRRHSEFANAVMLKLGAQIRRTATLMTVLAHSNAEARVAFFLAELSVRAGRNGKPAKEIDVPMSRRDIAAHLGLAYETAVRNLNKFRDDGLITWRQKTILVHDHMALQGLCSGAIKRL